MAVLTITHSTALLTSVSPEPPDMVLRDCSQCGATHHNGPTISLPLCEPCFDEFIAGQWGDHA